MGTEQLARPVAVGVRPSRFTERAVYLGLAIAITAAVVFGFARTFFLRPWYVDWAREHGAPEMIF